MSELLNERGTTHGEYSQNSAVHAALLDVLAQGPQYKILDPAKRIALIAICGKMARIVTGAPNFDDHWADIIGYAELVRKDLKGPDKDADDLGYMQSFKVRILFLATNINDDWHDDIWINALSWPNVLKIISDSEDINKRIICLQVQRASDNAILTTRKDVLDILAYRASQANRPLEKEMTRHE